MFFMPRNWILNLQTCALQFIKHEYSITIKYMIMDLALVAVLGLVGGLFLLIWFLVARHDKKKRNH